MEDTNKLPGRTFSTNGPINSIIAVIEASARVIAEDTCKLAATWCCSLPSNNGIREEIANRHASGYAYLCKSADLAKDGACRSGMC